LKSSAKVYCSVKCQQELRHKIFVMNWLAGAVDGGRGVTTRNMSGHVIRYLRETAGNACCLCGWDKINPVTGKVPLEIDHIDGNPDNNSADNLRLICPNCHSLTVNYRNLNRGSGRAWRRLKYLTNNTK